MVGAELRVGRDESPAPPMLDEQAVAQDGLVPRRDVRRRHRLQRQALPLERFSWPHRAYIEESPQGSFAIGDESHAAFERVLPEGVRERGVEMETWPVTLRIELGLEADMLQSTDVICMQVTDVDVRDVAVRESSTRQRPADVRAAVDQETAPVVCDQHHIGLKVVALQRMS